MIWIMYEVNLLEPFTGLCGKIVDISNLAKQIVTALFITSWWHIPVVPTVLIPNVHPTLVLILSDTFSEIHH